MHSLLPCTCNQIDMQKLIDFSVQTCPMPQEQAKNIAGFFTPKEFAKNDLLVKEGRVCNEYYFLNEGFARAFIYDLERNDITTAFYAPNNVLCELYSFFKRIPSKENIQALTNFTVWFHTFDEL